MTSQDDSLKQINRSGFPFQLRVEQEVTATNHTHHWSVESREHAWTNPEDGRSGFIDIVLKHEQYTTFRLVTECKRIKADDNRQLRWLFLLPDQDTKETTLASCLEVVGRMNKTGEARLWEDFRVWDSVNLAPPSLESEFCILTSDEQRRQPILEGLATEVLESIEGLAQEEINIAKSQTPASSTKLFIFPVIVTNAEITVCQFKPELIKIEDGTLDAKSAEIFAVPFIRFRKSLATNFPEGEYYDLRTANKARERTVFVVNAASISQFLSGWQVSPLDTFDGYAVRRLTR